MSGVLLVLCGTTILAVRVKIGLYGSIFFIYTICTILGGQWAWVLASDRLVTQADAGPQSDDVFTDKCKNRDLAAGERLLWYLFQFNFTTF